MSARIAQLFAALETTPGTPEAIVAASVLDFNDDTFTIESGVAQALRRAVTRRHQDRLKALQPPGNFFNLGFQTEVKTKIAGPEPCELDALWQAAGMSFSNNALVDTYTLVDNPNAPASEASVTILAEEDGGNDYSAAGVKLAFEIAWSADGPLLVNWTGVGSYIAPATNAGLTVVGDSDYHAGSPIVCFAQTNGFNFHAYDFILRSFSINHGATPEARPDKCGYYWPAFLMRGAEDHVNGTMQIESVDESSFDAWKAYMEGRAGPGIITMEDVAGNTFEILLEQVVFDSPAPSGTDLRLYDLPFTAARNTTTGTPSLTLQYTSAT